MILMTLSNVPLALRRLIAVAAVLCLFAAGVAEAATLSAVPATGVYQVGQTFTVSVGLSTNGAKVNAAEGVLSFNPREMTVVGLAKGAVFSLWTEEPSFSNAAGTVSFSGGSPSGYSGNGGTVLAITFQTTAAGSPRLAFTEGSVLAADGRGTNILSDMKGGAYTITARAASPAAEVVEYVPPKNTPAAPTISSETHPDRDGWSKNSTAELTWTVPAGVTAVRTLLSDNAQDIPVNVYDPPITSISLPDLADGVSYFHLQFQNADGWGSVGRYRLGIDTTAPESFTISLPADADLSNPIQTLVFEVADATSPVNVYMIRIDDREAERFVDEDNDGVVTLPELEPGYHSFIIEAFDAAHNGRVETFSFTIAAFERPQFTDYPSEINEEVIPVIKGQTRKRSTVEITVQKLGGGEPNRYTVASTDEGIFTFIPESTLSRGVYELTAISTDEFGARSEPSTPIRVVVQPPGFVQIGSLLVSVMSVVVPLLVLSLASVLSVWYFIVRWRQLRKTVRRESGEVAAIVAKEFDHLHALLETEVQKLTTSKKSQKLTVAETALFAHLKDELTAAEKRVGKEVKDVVDLVTKQKQ